MVEEEKEPAEAGAGAPASAGETQPPEQSEQGEQPEQTEENKPAADGAEMKFNIGYIITFAAAMLSFGISLAFGEIMYGVAFWGFTAITVQLAEFFIKSKRKLFLVTAIFSGVAALTMFILSIVDLCLG